MNRTEQAAQTDSAQAFKVNRIAAIGMTLAAAAALLLLRPELALVYVVYVAISVYSLSLTRRHGLLGKARPVPEQNLAAYVSVSTIGFLISLFAAPQMFQHMGSIIFIVIAAVMVVLVLYAIWDRK
ncbi:MAG: hypothetical protein ACSHXI_15740 [Hoeflea sp.]|uniref:hypothetical protein n=1 Tax=Hoeflea sp. TaxID=1940281 RepID=UPI003EF9503F